MPRISYYTFCLSFQTSFHLWKTRESPHQQEGIPNVKLLNAADMPLPIVSGDTPEAEELVAKLRETLQSTGAAMDDAGFYLAHAKAEL